MKISINSLLQFESKLFSQKVRFGRFLEIIIIFFFMVYFILGVLKPIIPFGHSLYRFFFSSMIFNFYTLGISIILSLFIFFRVFLDKRFPSSTRWACLFVMLFFVIKTAAIVKSRIYFPELANGFYVFLNIFHCICLCIFLVMAYLACIHKISSKFYYTIIVSLISVAVIQSILCIIESSLWAIGLSSAVESLPWVRRVFYLHDGSEFIHSVLRAKGTFNNPNSLAFFLAICGPINLGLCFTMKNRIKRYTLIASMLFITCALILSFSRAGWLGFVLGCLVILFYRFKNEKKNISLLLATSSIVMILVMMIFPSIRIRLFSFLNFSDKSISNRLLIWKDVLTMLLDYPLFGTGLGRFPEIFPDYQTANLRHFYPDPHSNWLYILVKHGFPGLIVFFVAIFFILKWILQNKHLDSISIGGAMIAALITGIFDYFFWLPYFILLFWILPCLHFYHVNIDGG